MTPDQRQARHGYLTSSEVAVLVPVPTRPMTEDELKAREKGNRRTTIEDPNAFTVGGETLIRQTRHEIRLGRPIDRDAGDTFATSWGTTLEYFAFKRFDTDYERRFHSKEFFEHPTIPRYGGCPDYSMPRVLAGDMKCPQLSAYMDAYECGTIHELRESLKDGEKFYWQLMSNSLILGVPECELVFFCPKRSMLDAVRTVALEADAWWWNWEDERLPYIPDESEIGPLKVFRWVADKADLELLESRLKLASERVLAKK
jgi:hypothetical protein